MNESYTSFAQVYDRSGEGNRAKMEQEADRYVTSFKELMNGGDSFF